MSGPTQHHWQHQVAKTRTPCDPRLNLTFRWIRSRNDEKLVDFGAERDKRIHDLHEKRLNDVRNAFEQAMPLGKSKSPASRKALNPSAAPPN